VKVLTTRVDERVIEDLEAIGREEKADRSEVARRLLERSIDRWKLEKALEMISRSRWTIRRGSEFARISYVQMVAEMADSGVDSGPVLGDLESSQ
jgi:hypothetical protein